MADEMVMDAGARPAETQGLTQMERVVDAFVAPSKTFRDILRNTSWWLPFLLMVVFSFASTRVIDRQVGFERIAENQIHASPRAEDAMSKLTPEQRAASVARSVKFTRIFSYGAPVFLLVFFALYSLIVWASFNFGLGAETTFGQVFAVTWYAALPYLFLSVLTIVTVYFGGDAEAYDMKNPVGTNIGYYMPDAAPWLRAMLSSIDLIKLWSVTLEIIGMAIIARKTMTQSAVIVGGLWLLGALGSTVAGAFS